MPDTVSYAERLKVLRSDKLEGGKPAFALAIAWCSILLGAVSGLVLGLWSFGGPFPTPEWIGPYDALPRRFLRLAHVALFALGMLHLMVFRQISATPTSRAADRLALRAMAFGNIAMPLALVSAAWWEPLKYVTPLPALSLTAAFAVAAVGAIRHSMGGSR
ncbi:MAG TPA: hypothetical protein VKA94_04670 [Hyphomicrobiales bacterium]|nr:hypothetical protein [Hyphomicrobiales bacterium]